MSIWVEVLEGDEVVDEFDAQDSCSEYGTYCGGCGSCSLAQADYYGYKARYKQYGPSQSRDFHDEHGRYTFIRRMKFSDAAWYFCRFNYVAIFSGHDRLYDVYKFNPHETNFGLSDRLNLIIERKRRRIKNLEREVRELICGGGLGRCKGCEYCQL